MAAFGRPCSFSMYKAFSFIQSSRSEPLVSVHLWYHDVDLQLESALSRDLVASMFVNMVLKRSV